MRFRISKASCAKSVGLCRLRLTTCAGLACARRISGGAYRTSWHHQSIRPHARLRRGCRRALATGGKQCDDGEKKQWFHRGSSGRSGLTSCLYSALAVNAGAGEAHLKGHRRNRRSAIRPRHVYVHRWSAVAAARDGRYTLTCVAPPQPRDSARHHRRTLPCRSPARDATGSRTDSRGRRR